MAPPPKPRLIRELPNVAPAFADGNEDIVLPVRGPIAAALARGHISSWQDRVEITAVSGNFPERSRTQDGINHREPYPFAIRVPSRPAGPLGFRPARKHPGIGAVTRRSI